jgi:hypothetical protein
MSPEQKRILKASQQVLIKLTGAFGREVRQDAPIDVGATGKIRFKFSSAPKSFRRLATGIWSAGILGVLVIAAGQLVPPLSAVLVLVWTELCFGMGGWDELGGRAEGVTLPGPGHRPPTLLCG